MALSCYDIKKILAPKSEAKPVDDFRIIDSWALYGQKKNVKVNDQDLQYLCYELETIQPESGEKMHYYKAVKFLRVIRIPKSLKQSTALMDMQSQILSSVYQQGFNLITIIANVIEPVALGLLYLYGIQGTGETLEDAKKAADRGYIGFSAAMQSTYRVLEMRCLNAQETEWLREKMYSMDYMTVIRGIPQAQNGGEDAGNKGIGGRNLNPDSQGTLEELITGLADYEYVLEVLSTPVFRSTLVEWCSQTEKSMTEWYGQMQGNKSFNMSLSIPIMFGSSSNTSHGWNKAYTDASSVSTNQGESYNTSYGENIGQSLSKSFGQTYGQTYGQSQSTSIGHTFGQSLGTSLNQSLSQGQSLSGSSGMSVGSTSGISQGQSYGWSNTQSSGLNHSLSNTESVGVTNGLSFNQTHGGTFGASSSGNVGGNDNSSLADNISTAINNAFNKNYSAVLGGTAGVDATGVNSNLSRGVGDSSSSSYNNGAGLNDGSGANWGFSKGLSGSINDSASIGQNVSASHSASVGETYGTSESNSIGQNYGVNQSTSQSQSVGQNTSSGWGQNLGLSTGVGQSSSQSYGLSATQTSGNSYSESLSNSVTQGSSQSYGQSQSVGQGSSYSTGTGESQSTSNGTSGTTAAGVSTSMGMGPSIGYSRSYQWLDQEVKDITEILEYQNLRIKHALRGDGAFYTYVYLACPGRDALAAAMTIAKSTWRNDNAFTEPLQVLQLSDEEQKHLLYHFSAFSSDVTREDVYGSKAYKYATILLPTEYVAYTHLPRISEGGIFAEIDDIPKFTVPSMMKGEIYMGTVLSAERYTMLNGYRTPFDYRIDEAEIMHGIFTGASRSGKTVAAMRFVAELAQVRRKSTGKRFRIVCMDPKQDWRTLARFVEPERFRFWSLGNASFRPIKINPLKIPHGVEPQVWIDGLIDIYCRAYGLLERGKQMMGETIYALYNEAGVFEARDHDGWEDKVPELSRQVTFEAVYKRMEQIKASAEDPNNPKGRIGNDTRDAYARLLDRLEAFEREYSIEHKLFGTSEGMGIDEMIGKDDVTILESKGLENTFRNFLFGIICSGFYKYALAHEKGYLAENQFETVLVVEEANQVFIGNDAAGSGGSKEFSLPGQSEFEQILDQAAGYGLFVIAITQTVSNMPKSIIANAGLIFAGRLVATDDIKVVMSAIGKEERIDDRDVLKWFPRSPIGWFVCKSSRNFDFKQSSPVLVQMSRLNMAPPSNAEIDELLLRKEAADKLKLNTK